MSAQEFKPGDRVRCIETWTTHVIDSGDEFTVEDVDPTTRNGLEVFVQGEWVPARYFEKVEPAPMFKPGDPVWIYPAELDGKPAWAIQRQTGAAEPEDKDDPYVEPEPLKGAGPAFNDDDVHHLKVISGSTTVFDGLAVFEEADNGNINVTPVPRCTSLGEKAGSILRCGRHEGHSDGHWTVGSTPAAAWSDERAYGRVVEGGAS